MFGREDLPPMPTNMPKLFITKDELTNGIFNEQQLAAMKIQWQKIDGIDREQTKRCKESMKQLNGRALRQIVDTSIRYMSQFASEELRSRQTNR